MLTVIMINYVFYHPRPDIVEKLKHLLVLREQLTKQSAATQNSIKAYKRHIVQEPIVMNIQQEHLNQIKEHIGQVDRQIKQLMKKDPDLWDMAQRLDTLCGVGVLLASYFLVTTNMFRDLSGHKQIAAFVGICPYEYKSGTSVHRHPHCRTFGSMSIKKLLHLASRSVATHNLNFRKYYLRKLDEGKSKKLVLNNIANKLVKIAAAMIRDKQPYIKNYRSVNPKLLAAC